MFRSVWVGQELKSSAPHPRHPPENLWGLLLRAERDSTTKPTFRALEFNYIRRIPWLFLAVVFRLGGSKGWV